MIPYDDLVVALAAWRARQGLPVAQGAGPPPAPTPPRASPPAPPRAQAPRAAPPPRAHSALDDFEDEALVEDGQYATVGEDYVLPLGGDLSEQAGEATAIGDVPEAPTEGLLTPKRGKRNPDW
jgi:hypothetical protein